MAAIDEQLICPSSALVDGGDGHRFWITQAGARMPAFAVRYRGQVHAYLNRCTHRFVELDWDSGRFYAIDGDHLICATHGALYRPDTGACAGGPCNGGLFKLALIEKNNGVYLAASAATRLSSDD